jgi:hypothetical protein
LICVFRLLRTILILSRLKLNNRRYFPLFSFYPKQTCNRLPPILFTRVSIFAPSGLSFMANTPYSTRRISSPEPTRDFSRRAVLLFRVTQVTRDHHLAHPVFPACLTCLVLICSYVICMTADEVLHASLPALTQPHSLRLFRLHTRRSARRYLIGTRALLP